MQLLGKYPDLKVLLLEKEATSALHQMGRNSGVIHAGVYYTPGSLKARFCYEGNKATKAFCQENGIKYDECGKLLVASNGLEMQRMQALLERTQENGLERTCLDAKELKELEPNITGPGKIFFPTSGEAF
ncbi:L-2-hydroxyglutarate oxidase [Helicobacter heilmannii]|nr:L-2-hydroxyglutarate oxidase [Helicobacter heilmannii]